MTASLQELRWWHLEPVLDLELIVFDDPWSAEMYWSELAQPSRSYVVALEDGAVVGYAGLGDFGDERHVQTIAVAPSAQGRGLGRQLLTALLEHAASGPVLLEVRTDNAGAQRLYRRAGFVDVGVRRGYYQPSGADALVMRLHEAADGIAALRA